MLFLEPFWSLRLLKGIWIFYKFWSSCYPILIEPSLLCSFGSCIFCCFFWSFLQVCKILRLYVGFDWKFWVKNHCFCLSWWRSKFDWKDLILCFSFCKRSMLHYFQVNNRYQLQPYAVLNLMLFRPEECHFFEQKQVLRWYRIIFFLLKMVSI